MSTNRRGKWGPKGQGPNGRALCFCGCGREVPKGNRTTFEQACYATWAAKHDPATQRRLVKKRDRGVCALCGVDTEARAREAEETRRVIRWLAHRHAHDLFGRGELEIYPGFTPAEKRYAQFIISSEGRKAAHLEDAYRWTEHWTREEMQRRFGETTGAGGHTWEADHIIPVIEGGGECDLSNLRTLCLACHKQETSKLARRRAERRRMAPSQLDLPIFDKVLHQ